jgi:hypothetical protein
LEFGGVTPTDLAIIRQAEQILHAWRTDIAVPDAIIALGAHDANNSDDIPHVSVQIRCGGDIYTGAALHLEDAVAIAKQKYADEVERLKKEKARASK